MPANNVKMNNVTDSDATGLYPQVNGHFSECKRWNSLSMTGSKPMLKVNAQVWRRSDKNFPNVLLCHFLTVTGVRDSLPDSFVQRDIYQVESRWLALLRRAKSFHKSLLNLRVRILGTQRHYGVWYTRFSACPKKLGALRSFDVFQHLKVQPRIEHVKFNRDDEISEVFQSICL